MRLGQQQIVEIARALSINSRILIMDEPTSALSATEVEVLFKVIRDLTAPRRVDRLHLPSSRGGAADHRLRRGAARRRDHGDAPKRKDIDLEWIVRHMVGENFDLGSPPTDTSFGDVALSIEDVSVADRFGRRTIRWSIACRLMSARARSSASTG